MDSLAARIIHCLLRVSNCETLENYLARLGSCNLTASTTKTNANNSWEQLLHDAETLYHTYVDTYTASKLQSDRLYADLGAKVGDMVYEGAVYFLRDALNLEELFDAVKCGHSGRILSILKIFTLSFQGSGRAQYARALLRLIHYCEIVWPPKLRAHGSNETWEWLVMITPCIGALRTLTKDLNEMIGNYRTTRHSSPDKMRDILKIIESLGKYKVYEVCEGRTFDNKCDPIVDSQSLGLEEYNKEFKRKQKAYQGPDIAHTSPGPDLMEVNWADNELGDENEVGDEAEGTAIEEELFNAVLPLETEDDVTLEVDAVDIWDMIYGSEVEEDFDWESDGAA
ncbi:hypothetical protein FRC06_005366 [Ceratobasidium sp. 370]|nr:hypothetical protein FRC06_005366 [Ceratobasidium sp. 370]